MNNSNRLLAAPELWVLVMACIILIADLFLREERRGIIHMLAMITLVFAAIITMRADYMINGDRSALAFGGAQDPHRSVGADTNIVGAPRNAAPAQGGTGIGQRRNGHNRKADRGFKDETHPLVRGGPRTNLTRGGRSRGVARYLPGREHGQ